MPRTTLSYTYVPNPPFSNDQVGCVDWDNDLGFFFSGDTYVFELTSRVQLAHIVGGFANINLTESAQTTSVSPADGVLYTGTHTSANLFIGYNGMTGATVSVYNDAPPTLPAIGNMCACEAGGEPICVGAGLNSGQGTPSSGSPVCAVNMQSLTSLGVPVAVSEYQISIAPGNALVGRGAPGQAWCAALGLSARPASVPATMGLYRIDLTTTSFTLNRLAGHVAADLGLAGNIDNIGAPTVDLSDGNMLVSFHTDTPASYLAKFNGISGALIWVLPTNQLIDLCECQIKHGQLQYIWSGTQYKIVNLATGTDAFDTYAPPSGTVPAIYFDDTRVLLVMNMNNNPFANPQWQTFGPPPSPFVVGGGVIRRRS